MIQSILKKLGIYTLVYLIVTILVSIDELLCALKLDTICLISFLSKWGIFIIIMYIYDRFIKPLFHKNIDKQ